MQSLTFLERVTRCDVVMSIYGFRTPKRDQAKSLVMKTSGRRFISCSKSQARSKAKITGGGGGGGGANWPSKATPSTNRH